MSVDNEEDRPPVYEGKSLYIFEVDNCLRKACINTIDSTIFGGFILLTILVNCIFLTLDDGDPNSRISKISVVADHTFTAIFTAEAVVRIIGQGFYWCGKDSYLRDSYNCLDFLVVVLSFVSFAGSGANLSFFRALRILKPLRAIKAIKGLRTLTSALFESLEGLGNVLLFFSFCLFVFGIIGMQAFGGRLKNRCLEGGTTTGWLDRTCWPNSLLDAYSCRSDESCADYGRNPSEGVVSFDNILVSWLTILQVTSLEGWVDVMYYCGDAVSKSISAFYFILCVMILSLFVRNLILAVLFIKFNAEKHTYQEQEIPETDFIPFLGDSVQLKPVNDPTSSAERKLFSKRDSKELSNKIHAAEDEKKQLVLSPNKVGNDESKHKAKEIVLDDGKSLSGLPTTENKNSEQNIPSESRSPEAAPLLNNSEQPLVARSQGNGEAEIKSKSNGEQPQAMEADGSHDSKLQPPRTLGLDKGVSPQPAFILPPRRGRRGRGGGNRGNGKRRGGGRQPAGRGRQAKLPTVIEKEKRSGMDVTAQDEAKLQSKMSAASPTPSAEEEPKGTIELQQSGENKSKEAPDDVKPNQSQNVMVGKEGTKRKPKSAGSTAKLREDVELDIIERKDKSARKQGQDGRLEDLEMKPLISLSPDDTEQQPNVRITNDVLQQYTDSNATNAADKSQNQVPSLQLVPGIHTFEEKGASSNERKRGDSRTELDFIKEMECYNRDWCCFDCPTWWDERIQSKLHDFVVTPAFQGWISIAIFVNTILLCIEHYDMSEELANFLDGMNIFLTIVFALEMVLKIVGLGWQEYCDDNMNIFDALVVIISFIELSLGSSSGLTALRCFRLLRLLKLFRNWPDLRSKVDALFNSMEEILYFVGLVFLFMFIYAILGVQLFRGKFVIDGETQRPNFDTFLWSMLTVFQIITGENWNEILAVGVRVAGWGSSMYFVTLYLFGSVLLDLFLAILLTHLMDAEKEEHQFGGVSFSDLMISAVLCRFREPTPEENPNTSSSRSKVVDNYPPILSAREVRTDSTEQPPLILPSPSTKVEGQENKPTKPKLVLAKSFSSNFLSSPLPTVDETSPVDCSEQDVKSLSIGTKSGGRPPRKSRAKRQKTLIRTRSFTASERKGEKETSSPADAIFIQAKNEVLENPTLPAAAYSKRAKEKVIIVEGKSFLLFSPDNSFRMMVLNIVESEKFTAFIMFLIFFSCVLLTLDQPRLDPGSTLGKFLFISDIVLTAIFTLEMLLKCIAFGCWGSNKVHPEDFDEMDTSDQKEGDKALSPSSLALQGELTHRGFALNHMVADEVEESSDEIQGPYFTDGWNVLDAVVVFISLVNIFAGSLAFFKAFRALRSLRALRAVSRSEETKVVMKTIIKTFFKLHNILLIALMIFIIFAVIGVQFFQGRLRMCIGDDGTRYPDLNIDTCESLGHTWKNPELRNFDNTGSAMILLFEVASMEMWPDIMFSVIDATPPGEPPKENYNPPASLYFVTFLVLGSFLIVSMFVGAVVGVYEEESDKLMERADGEDQDLADLKKLWLEVYKIMVENKPSYVMMEPEEEWRKKFFFVAEHDTFEIFIMSVICINVLLMAMSYHGASEEYLFGLEILNTICSCIFMLEMVIKMIGLGLKQYFGNGWNQFDFFLVMVSILTMALQSVVTLAVDPTIFRIFRILRIFRLLPKAEGLKKMIRTLKFSLPALYNILFLLGLFIFVFAVMGMSLFGKVKHGDFLDDHANFELFPTAVVTLFRITTGESWNGIMHDCMIQPPECTKGEDCGSVPWALIFFPLYILVSFYAMLNLFVAVVLKNFEAEEGKSGDGNKEFWGKSPVLQGDIEKYCEMWSEVFPNKRYIHLDQLIKWGVHLQLVNSEEKVDKKDGTTIKKTRHFPLKVTRREMKALNIPLWNDKVHYLSLLQKICLKKFVQRFEMLHQMKTEKALKNGEKPPKPITGSVEATFLKGINRDNQMLQCINASAQGEYPELSKLKNFVFLSNQYFAAGLLKNWWFARKAARGEKVRTREAVVEEEEDVGICQQVLDKLKEIFCCRE